MIILGDTIPSDVEQATGLEKKELDALLSGVEVTILNTQFEPTTPDMVQMDVADSLSYVLHVFSSCSHCIEKCLCSGILVKLQIVQLVTYNS